MRKAIHVLEKKAILLLTIFCLILIGGLGFGATQYYALSTELELTKAQVASSTYVYKSVSESMREKLSMTTTALIDEQSRNTQIQAQISGIQNTVNLIQKVNATDEELLQKYSKVYFLNENYIPARLAPIDSSYSFNTDKVDVVHADVWPFLKRMLDGARAQGNDLKIISSYRSFGEQTSLKTSYKMMYGTGANAFSAEQGYSEHQLGTAVDVTVPKVGGTFTSFEKDPAYAWLKEHAHEYGFILSYPKGNLYYIFEPWHWRFVGTALATRLHSEGKYFYDMDQREIDTYRGVIFD